VAALWPRSLAQRRRSSRVIRVRRARLIISQCYVPPYMTYGCGIANRLPAHLVLSLATIRLRFNLRSSSLNIYTFGKYTFLFSFFTLPILRHVRPLPLHPRRLSRSAPDCRAASDRRQPRATDRQSRRCSIRSHCRPQECAQRHRRGVPRNLSRWHLHPMRRYEGGPPRPNFYRGRERPPSVRPTLLHSTWWLE